MQKVSSVVVLSLIAVGAAAALLVHTAASDPETETAGVVANLFDNEAAIDERLLALEAAVSEERQARQLLEDELMELYAHIDRLEGERQALDVAQIGNLPAGSIAQRVDAIALQESSDTDADASRRDAMLAAGLSPQRVEHILRRESEMRFEMLQAYYDAQKSGEPMSRSAFGFGPDAMLREDIGDSDYEKYLQANGRPTSVEVGSVMAASPAERAGLQPGDEIVGYDGQRVFTTSELMQRTMSDGDGDVVVDVVRNGSQMQIVLPRGPIGIEQRRFRGR